MNKRFLLLSLTFLSIYFIAASAQAEVIHIEERYSLSSEFIPTAIEITGDQNEEREAQKAPLEVQTYRIKPERSFQLFSSFSKTHVIPLNENDIIQISHDHGSFQLFGFKDLSVDVSFTYGNWSDLVSGREFVTEGRSEEESSPNDRIIPPTSLRFFDSSLCYKLASSHWSSTLAKNARHVPGLLPDCEPSRVKVFQKVVTSVKFQKIKKLTMLLIGVDFFVTDAQMRSPFLDP